MIKSRITEHRKNWRTRRRVLIWGMLLWGSNTSKLFNIELQQTKAMFGEKHRRISKCKGIENVSLWYEQCVTFWRLGRKLCGYLLCVRQTSMPPPEEPILVVLASLTGALVGAGVKAGLAGWPQLWQGKPKENPVSTVLFSGVRWRPEILPLVVRF